jgi:hypothetical protein
MMIALLAPADLRLLVELFSGIVTRGNLESPAIIRESGVSFNPRPARIIEILIKEVLSNEPLPIQTSLVKASLLVNLIEDITPALTESPPVVSETSWYRNPAEWELGFRTEMLMAKDVLAFERAPSDSSMEEIEEAENLYLGIAFSRALDTMRHAHISDPKLFDKERNLRIATTLLQVSKRSGKYPRVATLLETATARFQRRR